MFVYGEGSVVWKEFGVMKDFFLQLKIYGYFFRELLGGFGVGLVVLLERLFIFQMEDVIRIFLGVYIYEVILIL